MNALITLNGGGRCAWVDDAGDAGEEEEEEEVEEEKEEAKVEEEEREDWVIAADTGTGDGTIDPLVGIDDNPTPTVGDDEWRFDEWRTWDDVTI